MKIKKNGKVINLTESDIRKILMFEQDDVEDIKDKLDKLKKKINSIESAYYSGGYQEDIVNGMVDVINSSYELLQAIKSQPDDSYKTKLKDSTAELATMIYNLYYQLPIPIISLTLGAVVGSTELQCATCSSYDKGTANQWYASLGMPIIPLFDIHLSYRSVSSKIKALSGGGELDVGGNVMGVGIGFNF